MTFRCVYKIMLNRNVSVGIYKGFTCVYTCACNMSESFLLCIIYNYDNIKYNMYQLLHRSVNYVLVNIPLLLIY